jgi:peptidoglycan/LPS O-acetylase OafA/YrhL
MLFNLLALFSFLIVLLLLRRLVNILPSLMACLFRGKENLNLEASVKLSLDRDALALAMIIPFCLTACRYKMYSPGFLQGLSDNAYLGICFGVFFVYMILRFIMNWIFRPKKMPKKVYSAAGKASYSFFIIYTLLILAIGAVYGLLDMPEADVRSAMLWVSAAIYALFLIRKTQIFSSSCSIFTAFLYLCALEMIPTGILVVSAIIF